MNTVDKPKTKATDVTRSFRELDVVEFISCTLIPAIYAKYAGTIGKTQGDKKLNTPAAVDINRANINGDEKRSTSAMLD